MSNFRPLLFLAIALVAGQARAECVGPSDVIEACQEIDAADAEPNKAYRELIKQLGSPPAGLEAHNAAAKKSLVAAQRSWLEFREKDCLAVSISLMAPQELRSVLPARRNMIYCGPNN